MKTIMVSFLSLEMNLHLESATYVEMSLRFSIGFCWLHDLRKEHTYV